MDPRRGVCLLLVTSLLAAGLVGVYGVAAGEPGPPRSSTSPAEVLAGTTSSGHADIVDTQRLALAPAHPGEIRASHEYTLPATLTRFEVRLTDRMTLLAYDGFDRQDDHTLRWDGETASPSITYRAGVNRTIDRDDPLAAPGDYLFVDTGDWALFQRPQLSYGWGWRGDRAVGLTRAAATDGPGVASDVVAFLGPHEVHTHTAHGQEFVLVEPAAASMSEEPAAVFDALSHAADHLRVGNRDDTVTLVAAPTNDVSWGVRGLQTGPADIWVRDREALSDPENVWIHEYVHSRQGFVADDTARWLTEGTAAYYAALFAFETEQISHEQFQRTIARGSKPWFADVRLTDPATWHQHANYRLGPLVTGALDRSIRLDRAAERSFADVMRRLNEHEEVVDHGVVRDVLADIGGGGIAAEGDDWLTTDNRPETWAADAHQEAFGTPPARVAYQLPSGAQVQISGPYRNQSVPTGEPVEIVRGETVSLPVSTTNRGGATAQVDARPRYGVERGERLSGTLAPGERTEIQLTREFTTPGTYRVALDEAAVQVRVHEPAALTVSDLGAEPRAVVAGEEIELRVSVRNDAAIPADGTVQVTAGDRELVSERVRLDAGAERELVRTVRFDEPGSMRIAVADTPVDPVTITVREAGTGGMPGFGVLAGLVAVVVGTGLLVRGAVRVPGP